MAQRRSLLPREYGAYAELLFPLTTGLALGRPTAAAVLFAAAAVAWFLMHEPFAVLTGVRGARAREILSARARARLRMLLGGGAVAGLAAVLFADPDARLAVLVPISCGVALAPAVLRGRQKTLGAEIVLIAALSGMVLPVGLAGGVEWSLAWLAAAVWFVSFVLGTVTVHGIKAAHKQTFGTRWTPYVPVVLAPMLVAIAALAAAAGAVPPAIVAALLPSSVVAVVFSVLRVHPRRLRIVGWSLVTGNVVTLVILLAA
ncbi:MAG: hypothetical protein GTN78_04310 [Gemmatimonadales bacterium]|nr:hypothetical protein [Gemmatimonadales bacterium]NIQ99409.1 hypothetical protein [Gemmatimonadales bacterium]NIS64077.1 hypothetical protein [Gemmatimonadales bacterium]